MFSATSGYIGGRFAGEYPIYTYTYIPYTHTLQTTVLLKTYSYSGSPREGLSTWMNLASGNVEPIDWQTRHFHGLTFRSAQSICLCPPPQVQSPHFHSGMHTRDAPALRATGNCRRMTQTRMQINTPRIQGQLRSDSFTPRPHHPMAKGCAPPNPHVRRSWGTGRMPQVHCKPHGAPGILAPRIRATSCLLHVDDEHAWSGAGLQLCPPAQGLWSEPLSPRTGHHSFLHHIVHASLGLTGQLFELMQLITYRLADAPLPRPDLSVGSKHLLVPTPTSTEPTLP